MALQDMYDFSIIENEAERLILQEIERQLDPEDMEYNEDFIFDIATLALNNVPPAYRSTLLGKLYSSTLEDSDYMEKVKKAVTSAISKVKNNPPK